jgi:hypothetical protein
VNPKLNGVPERISAKSERSNYHELAARAGVVEEPVLVSERNRVRARKIQIVLAHAIGITAIPSGVIGILRPPTVAAFV